MRMRGLTAVQIAGKGSIEREYLVTPRAMRDIDTSRSDLLNRHRAAHVKNAGERFRRRTGRACEACIKAKTKCDEERPCKRCKSRDQSCQESEARRGSLSRDSEAQATPPSIIGDLDDVLGIRAEDYQELHFNGSDVTPSAVAAQPSQLFDAMQQSLGSESSTIIAQPGQLLNTMQQPTPLLATRHLEDASLLLGLNGGTSSGTGMTPFDTMPTDLQGNDYTFNGGFPDFFEQVMMPASEVGTQAHHTTAMPIDVSNFTQDLTFDTCDFDFTFLAGGLTRPPSAQGFHPEDTIASSTVEMPQSDAQLRSEAFKRSPWSWNHWMPERDSHTFSGQEEINMQEDRVNASDQLTSPGTVRFVHCALDQAARDRMIRTVTQVAHQRVAIPSFPSLELLEDLVDVFLLQDSNSIDSFLHAATFDCRQTRTELLLAMVAAGARYIALAPVWKMGLVIQEVVRMAIAEVFESDNSSTRELQALQISLIWLDIGVFSGFRRKTEIALSFLQPLVTMLSWANAFQKAQHHQIVPEPDDSDNVLAGKWKAWAHQESFKRLMLHTFLHDSQVALVNMKNPLLSPAQMRFQLPASRDLWLAPNAHAWRYVWQTKLSMRSTQHIEFPTMAEFFSNNGTLEPIGDTVDRQLCMLAACHGLGQEVWHFRQHARLLADWQNQGRRDRSLAHQTQQRDLYDDLTAVQAHCELAAASLETVLTLDLLMMTLHVDLEDVLTFSGKSGEDEARKVFPRIRAWAASAEARTAVRHAGQVFKVARAFEKSRLRDFYAVALYHSALTIWVYGMVTSNAARKSGEQTPRGTPRMSNSHVLLSPPSHRTLVDAGEEKAVKAFTLLGQGTPGIQDMQLAFVPLTNGKGVMMAAEAILKNNFPQSSNGLPPLVENLANLMSELGKLSGR